MHKVAIEVGTDKGKPPRFKAGADLSKNVHRIELEIEPNHEDDKIKVEIDSSCIIE